jgi:adenine-specific DNA-methyltransferase
MSTGDDTKLPLTSRDVHAERLTQFRALFPEAFTEGKADLPKLAQLLADSATDAPERYGLSWAGKSEAIRAIQITSPGTLLPARGESVNFDATENLIIEGDNLETLKLLQGGYHGRVKMIYIDPPYNTGGEFIYPDNYKEGLADYLKFSGQVSGEGIRLTTNAETDGRYHSKWLTMMYPRLFLARNLLREDGVIFVSIDDHEVHNLRAVMNEIFGEENFVAQFAWQSRQSIQNDTDVSQNHEYVIGYAKNRRLQDRRLKESNAAKWYQVNQFAAYPLPLDKDKFSNPDMDSRGDWKADPFDAPGVRENLEYPITNPKTGEIHRPPAGRHWRTEEINFNQLLADNRIVFGKTGESKPQLKVFYQEKEPYGEVENTWLEGSRAGTATHGTKELQALFDEIIFESPKPTTLIQLLLRISTLKEGIILDFFAGSGTTAQAVLELNAQDGGNRKFILVQLPEPTERKDFPTIADITKERVRRVIKKLEAELTAKNAENTKKSASELPLEDSESLRSLRSLRLNQDLGFKVFKLGSSNFKVWDAATAPKDGPALAEQLKLMAHNVEDGRPDDALLYELVLKSNLPLTSKITSGQIGAQTYYDVADGTLAICLARPITQETLRGLIARKPKGVICLDIAFAGNDQLKANTVLEMKSHGIEFHTA